MLEFTFSITRVLSVFGLFILTAIAEILGCYFPYLILNQGKSHWLWIPTALSLTVFVWLLTLHPAASGRIYAAYGGIYIFTALLWLRYVDQVQGIFVLNQLGLHYYSGNYSHYQQQHLIQVEALSKAVHQEKKRN